MIITSDFEGGRIELKGAHATAQGVLAIPPDVRTVPAGTDPATPPALPPTPGLPAEFRQWFAFDAEGEVGTEQRFRIENAGACVFGDAFGGLYKVYASYGGDAWFRVPTTFENGVLSFSHVPERARVRYAYYPLYSSARLARLLVEAPSLGLGTSRALATTERGGQVHVIEMGVVDHPDPRHLWIVAQQHPGEHMAGWFVEGLVDKLCSRDERATALLARARIHIVPRMNPDGCALANHRTNAFGRDLNRQWAQPAVDAPEVKAVREAMLASGVSFFLDAHGDERLPYVFTQLPDLHPARPPRVAPLEARFEERFAARSSDFQNTRKYPYGPRKEPNLAIASTWAQNTFGALSATLEMPFTDNANAPMDEGWSPERSKRLGAALADTLADLVDELTPSLPVLPAATSEKT